MDCDRTVIRPAGWCCLGDQQKWAQPRDQRKRPDRKGSSHHTEYQNTIAVLVKAIVQGVFLKTPRDSVVAQFALPGGPSSRLRCRSGFVAAKARAGSSVASLHQTEPVPRFAVDVRSRVRDCA